jgi:hypothetical protein
MIKLSEAAAFEKAERQNYQSSDRGGAYQASHPDTARWRLAIDDRDALASTLRAALSQSTGVRLPGVNNFRPGRELSS